MTHKPTIFNTPQPGERIIAVRRGWPDAPATVIGENGRGGIYALLDAARDSVVAVRDWRRLFDTDYAALETSALDAEDTAVSDYWRAIRAR